jgi:curli biogenesis system outer membrane secretion channel CsgG
MLTLTPLLIFGLLMQSATPSHVPAAQSSAVASPTVQPAVPPATLRTVKRIYVDSFGEDPTSKELQSMIVSSLTQTKQFTVTENRDRADAIRKGVALEKTSQEVHAFSEGTSAGVAAGASQGSVTGSVLNGNGTISGSSSGGFSARHLGSNESSLNTETVNDARVAIRLVNSDGDVIWTSTQESKGAKYRSSSADVADKCVKQLLHDIEKLDAPSIAPAAVPAASHKVDGMSSSYQANPCPRTKN